MNEVGDGAAGAETAKRFPTVGIGTSAGGVHALQMFFESLPDDVDAAFVVVVHLDPARQSELSTILAARTKMPVTQVTGLTPHRTAPRLCHPAQPAASRDRSSFGDRRVRRASLAARADRSFLSLARRGARRRLRHYSFRRGFGRLRRHQGGQGGGRHHPGPGPGRGRIWIDAAQRRRDGPR